MEKYVIRVKDRSNLMRSILNYNARPRYISFEGYLKDYITDMLYGQTDYNNTILRRNSISDTDTYTSDFVVFDLSKIGTDSILQIINADINIFHIKVCHKNELLLEAYDHFQHCYLDAGFYNSTFVSELISRNIIEVVELIRA